MKLNFKTHMENIQKKRGRPRINELRKNVNVRFSQNELIEIERIAAIQDWSISKVVRKSFEYGLPALKSHYSVPQS